MKDDDIKKGLLVEVTRLESHPGILADSQYIETRQKGRGIVQMIHHRESGESIVWVRVNGDLSPYWGHELELVGAPDP